MHKNKISYGIIWSGIEKFSVQGVQFIISIVLARLLSPKEFGLIAIIISFSSIFQTINESGINTALIRKLDRDDLDYNTAFYSNIVIGFFSYLLLYFLSNYISTFYETPELSILLKVLPLTLVINSFNIVHFAILTIKIDFKTQAKASFYATLISGVISIIHALIYSNVYSIVIQYLSFSIFNLFFIWTLNKWRPSILFSYSRFKNLFHFAYKLILARLISILYDDLYTLTIGKLFSNQQLGFYNRANSFLQVSSKSIIHVIQRVSIPVLCSHQNNLQHLEQSFTKFLSLAAFIVYPILALLIVLGKPLICVLLGYKWLPASYILLIIAPIGFFYLISTFNRNIYNATGRSDLALRGEIIKKSIFLIVFILTIRFNIYIFLFGLLINSLIEMFYDMYYTKKQIGITFKQQFLSIYKIIICTLFMSLIVYLIIIPIDILLYKLLIGTTIGILSYLIISILFNIVNIRDEISYYFFKK